MPGKNTIRYYMNDSFYHVYNRGVNKNRVFKDDEDYRVYLNLLKRYLSEEPQIHPKNGIYPSFYKQVELLAFCLMPNHYHLLLYQKQDGGVKELLRSLGTSYGMYFNKKYKRVGPVFQGRFRAVLVQNDIYLQHISRYIHLNPKSYAHWEYSSYNYYIGDKRAQWIKPGRILELFNSHNEYKKFLENYVDYKNTLDDLEHELADK